MSDVQANAEDPAKTAVSSISNSDSNASAAEPPRLEIPDELLNKEVSFFKLIFELLSN